VSEETSRPKLCWRVVAILMPFWACGRTACNQLLMKISCRGLPRRQQAMKVVAF